MIPDITNELLACRTVYDIVGVIKKITPRYHGYRVSRVVILPDRLEVWGEERRWRDGEIVTGETLVSGVSLPSGYDIVGRKSYIGLAPVDIEIIKNIVSS
jgi:hypothetical protein